jgi:hypothetical protein
MKYSLADIATALGIPTLAALGGGFAVYAGYDDAPGGVLIGLVMVLGAMALGLRRTREAR